MAVFLIQLSMVPLSHKMHFDFSRIDLLQFLDYTDFFETKFLYSSVNLLFMVGKWTEGLETVIGWVISSIVFSPKGNAP